MGKWVLVMALGLVVTAGAARADRLDALRDDSRLHNGLLVITIGRHIERRCPTIARRSLVTNAFLLGLARHAMSLGFSRAEVTRYVEDPTEQERFIALARRYFAERDVMQEGDTEGACRVGRDEIAAGSPIGRLLREG